MSTQVIVILYGIGAVVLLWLALRFGRQIAWAVLVVGILAVGIITSLALLTQASANRETAQAVKVVSMGQSFTLVASVACAGMLSMAAVGAAGLFWLRWKLEKRRWQLPQHSPRRNLPHREPPEVVYIVEDEGDALPIGDLDLTRWGW